MKICFTGQVSTGKSSVINSLFGREVCPVSLLRCTLEPREIACAGEIAGVVEVIDLPGLNDSDGEFMGVVKRELSAADLLVYVTSAETAFVHESEIKVFENLMQTIDKNNAEFMGPYQVAVLVNKYEDDSDELHEVFKRAADKVTGICKKSKIDLQIFKFSAHRHFLQRTGIRSLPKEASSEMKKIIRQSAFVDDAENAKFVNYLANAKKEPLIVDVVRKRVRSIGGLDVAFHHVSRTNVAIFVKSEGSTEEVFFERFFAGVDKWGDVQLVRNLRRAGFIGDAYIYTELGFFRRIQARKWSLSRASE